jgi:hypothetical protein
MFRGDALNGIRDEFAGALLTFFARFGFDLADDARHVAACFLFNSGKEVFARIVWCHLRDLFEALHLFFVQLVDLVPAPVDLRLAAVEVLLALLHLIETAVEFGAAFVEPFGLAVQLDAPFLDLRLSRLDDPGGILTCAAFDHTRLCVGGFQNIVCLVLLGFCGTVHLVSVEKVTGSHADDERQNFYEYGDRVHVRSSSS